MTLKVIFYRSWNYNCTNMVDTNLTDARMCVEKKPERVRNMGSFQGSSLSYPSRTKTTMNFAVVIEDKYEYNTLGSTREAPTTNTPTHTPRTQQKKKGI